MNPRTLTATPVKDSGLRLDTHSTLLDRLDYPRRQGAFASLETA